MHNGFELLINSFLDDNIGVDPLFVSDDLAAGLRANICQLQKNEQMIPAGVGHGNAKLTDTKVRGDKIYWLDKSHDNPCEQKFLRIVEDFIDHLNRTCYTGINGYEFHYTVYEEGSFYRRHRDQFKTNSHRKYSLISYLNEDWQDADGGQLLIYQDSHVKSISPLSRTAVFFKSDEIEHEVAMAHRPRMSVTGWLKRV